MINSYNRQDTVFITVGHEIYNFIADTWSYGDPDSGYPKITIIDSKGTTKVNAVTMDKDVAGKFQYFYEIAADAETGSWRGYIDVKNGGYPDREYFSFEVTT